jgi:hypothetical protein
MKPSLTYDSLHNPFRNRFDHPVTCRLDEMQSYAHKVWLRERNQGNCGTQCNAGAMPMSAIVDKPTASSAGALDPWNGGKLFASILALFLVLGMVLGLWS